MTSHLQPDRTSPAAARRHGVARPSGGPGRLPGWRPLLAAIGVVLALALLLHLLYR